MIAGFCSSVGHDPAEMLMIIWNLQPKSAHPAAKKTIAEIWGAEDKTHAQAAAKQFQELFGAKFGKAVKITDDTDELLAFYDYPTIPPNTGCICAPRTRSSRLSPPSGTAPRSPAAGAPRPRDWPWPSH
jgi:hypothetical protein